nr:MAG TPA: hypothetical protein [Caudoviricetes sp.]DAR87439.1 MAG TPA: hypothetical protein [Caudoviricetes sp.]DAW73240.1 MAG TPA: hypothetical protein [Caudoviricetes sp.]
MNINSVVHSWATSTYIPCIEFYINYPLRNNKVRLSCSISIST